MAVRTSTALSVASWVESEMVVGWIPAQRMYNTSTHSHTHEHTHSIQQRWDTGDKARYLQLMIGETGSGRSKKIGSWVNTQCRYNDYVNCMGTFYQERNFLRSLRQAERRLPAMMTTVVVPSPASTS